MAFEDEVELTVDDQQESEEDLSINASHIHEAVLFNTDWTVETLYRQIEKGNINLDPKFQRREAWNEERKSKLIESILCNYPIPNVVLAEDKSAKGKYIVIDGKQRLTSIFSFLNNELTLEKLTLRPDLLGKKYSDLQTDQTADISSLENYPIRTIIIRNWPDEDYLYSVFYRLNSGSLALSPQELRKALHGGQLLDAITDFIAESDEFKRVFGPKPDPRMRDVEIVLRYVAFETQFKDYDGNLKRFLDNTVKHFDVSWATAEAEANESFKKLDIALANTYSIFGENSFKKWNGEKYERRVNRAIIDIMSRFLSNIDSIPASKAQEVEERFKQICQNNTSFRDAIERTTKTPSAVKARHLIWGEQLAQALDMQLDTESMRLV